MGATLGNADNNLGMAPLGVSAALATILSSYNQEAELEADESGLLMMAKAGYDPRGLSSFLRSLRTRERLTGLGYHGLLATHPETAARIAKAEIMAPIQDFLTRVESRTAAEVQQLRRRGERLLVVVIAGLGILATEVSWAERLLAYAKKRANVESVTAQHPWIKPVSIVLMVLGVAASLLYTFRWR